MQIIILVICLAAGFGLGRIKNTAKLAAVRAYIDKVEAAASTEVKQIIADVRAKL